MHILATRLFQIRTTNEDDLRRGRISIVAALIMIGLAILALPISATSTNPVSSIATLAIGIIAYLISIIAIRAGFINTGGLILISFVTLPILIPIALNTLSDGSVTLPFYLALSLLAAGIILRPPFIWIVLTVNLVGLFIVWNIARYNPFTNTQTLSLSAAALFLQVSTAVFTFIGGQITDTILREARQLREEARQSAAQLATLNATLEVQVSERTAALEQAIHELEQRAAEQARLLAENEQQRQVIRELSVPVLPVRETALVMPLVGALDTARLADMQQQALEQIARTNARDLFIDVTGVPVIDTQVARGLIQVVEAARLMGTRVTLVGIRPEVAQTLVTLGIDLHTIRTFSTLQAALGGDRR
ncbi:STAS domain-containing protein [Chloroflexus sp.]|uniref:STAS domain-containing protein n=1 Tax=Chloroflexus sp. TaxID=1904827 RepID=UPI00404B5633